MIDDCNINKLAKNQVSVVFYSRAIRRSVLPKFRELCIESPCLCPSEGHKHGGRDLTKTSVVSFAIEMRKTFTLEFRQIEINASSSASTVLLAKTTAITHLLTYATALSGRHFMSRNGKVWKFKRALLQKKETRPAKTLSNVMFLQDLLSDATKTSEGKVVFNFGI